MEKPYSPLTGILKLLRALSVGFGKRLPNRVGIIRAYNTELGLLTGRMKMDQNRVGLTRWDKRQLLDDLLECCEYSELCLENTN